MSLHIPIIPSFAQGFATHLMSAAPDLWGGVVGAWAPFLGKQGNKLYDWSGFRNHGTINGATWGAEGNGPVLSFDGDDIITLASQVSITSIRYTIIFWCNNLANNKLLIGRTGDTNSYAGYFFNGIIHHKCNNAGLNFVGSTHGLGNTFSAIHCWAIRRNGNGNDVDFFLAGNRITTDIIVGTLPNNSFTPDKIGCRGDNTFCFSGSLERVLMFNDSLSDHAIKDVCLNPYAQYSRPFNPAILGGVIPIEVMDLFKPQIKSLKQEGRIKGLKQGYQIENSKQEGQIKWPQ